METSQNIKHRPAAAATDLAVGRLSSISSRISHSEELELGRGLAEHRRELLALALQTPESIRELHQIDVELESGALRVQDVLELEDLSVDAAAAEFELWRRAVLSLQREAARLWPSLDPELEPIAGAELPAETHPAPSRAVVEQHLQRGIALIDSIPLSSSISSRLLGSAWPEAVEADVEAGERATTPRPLPAPLERRARAIQTQMARIRSRFVTANQGLVSYIAQRYRGMGMSHDDLMQEGNIGLLRAVEKFDHRRGGRFGTYAVWWIRQGVRRALANQSRTIRIPVHALGTRYTLDQTAKRLTAQLGRQPTEQELAQATGVVASSVSQLMALVKEPLSLDAPRGPENEARLGDSIADVDAPSAADQTLAKQQAVQLHQLLESLSPREQEMLRMRFGLDGSDECTLEQIGRTFAVTRERVRQIVGAALDRLHRQTQLRRLELEPRGD